MNMQTNQTKSMGRPMARRLITAILLLVVLGCVLTSCGGAAKITSIKKGYTITASMLTEANGLNDVQLDKLAEPTVED